MSNFDYRKYFAVKADENTYYYINIDDLFDLYEKYENCLEITRNEKICNKQMMMTIFDMYERGIVKQATSEEINELRKKKEVILTSN
ncbi:MAG: hypothetical protein QW478_13750 [Candidatus Micrarchaeaceae archaeon]